jgi:hypothetical protein
MNQDTSKPSLVRPALLLLVHLSLYGCAGPHSEPPGNQPGRNSSVEAQPTPAPGTAIQGTGTAPAAEPPAGAAGMELPYAELVRQMGTPEEQQRVQEYLAGESNDPAVRDFLISWYLDRKDYDSARALIARAEADEQPVPVWQRLAIAVEDNDQEAVDRLVRESRGQLTPSAEVDALQRVGLERQALARAQVRLGDLQTGPEMERLATQADALAMAPASYAEARGNYQELGDLNISTGGAALSTDTPWARIAVNYAHNRLDSDNDDVSVDDFDNEDDIALQAVHTSMSRQLAMQIGTNLRDDEDIVYGQLAWDEYFSPRLSARAELDINQITIATAFLRAIGTKDAVSLGGAFNPNRWEFARGRFEVHRYQTRDDKRLGDGFLAEAALGRVLLQELPRWHVELRGSWEKNDLRDKVPTELIPAVLPPSTDIESIIPPDFRTLGVATTLDYGAAGTGAARRARVLFDGFAGWQWPENDATYNVRLGLGTSLFSRDILSLDAYYANNFSGVTDQAYKGIGVSYRLYY